MVIRTALFVSVSCLVLAVRTGFALPDLTPAIYGIDLQTNTTVDQGDVTEGCASRTSGLKLLRFGTKVENVGDQDLVIGNPGCPDCTQNPGASCQNPLFVCSNGLNVAHYRAAARFELLDPSGNDVIVGSKRGYCFNDDECTDGKSPKYTSCDDQGLSVDCIDVYEPFLSCQYLDVTSVPDVETRAFVLRVTVDTTYSLPDANRGNNVAQVAIPGCGDGIVQPGEDCDAGPNAGATCCDSHCHFLPAGTTCHPPAGVCDVAQTCDGASGACPAALQRPGTCAVDGACVNAGTPDPNDACMLCDPSVDPGAWSPDVAADAQGIQCQLNRLATAIQTAACSRKVSRTLVSPLKTLQRQVARHVAGSSHGGSPQALVRTANRLKKVLARAGKRPGCDVESAGPALDVLMTQLRTLAAEKRH
jgi:hypothetical protein